MINPDHNEQQLRIIDLENMIRTLDHKVEQFEIERVELKKAVKNLSLYLEVRDI